MVDYGVLLEKSVLTVTLEWCIADDTKVVALSPTDGSDTLQHSHGDINYCVNQKMIS